MSKNTNIKVVTGLVGFANVHLYKPMSWVQGASPKYSVTIIIPKSDTKTIESINSAFAQVLELNKSKLTNKPMIPYGLKDGDAERGDPLYSDAYFINASTSEKPGIVDVDLNPLIESNDVYDGCYGRVSITFFAYSVNGKGGVGVGLNNVQKLKDGEPNQKPISDFADKGGEIV
ncbi:DUF2815 family protein [Polynucleobacter paneuropaeus]|jgi:hypothetical protein|uniref:DUF2815 family protein n=1 Tax=Polynucleobacter paneuropaeus TaxID=2527775 RepID=UPI001BFE2A93|nr:DUF2815 family protein [Polynucleobacter paneuropaeus]MBT8633409.1 DUF2815 family protein [Polynucleobacter paneuropaeus]